MHKTMIARVSVPEGAAVVWTLAQAKKGSVTINAELVGDGDAKRLVLTSYSLAGIEIVGVLARGDLERTMVSLMSDGWRVSVPKFTTKYLRTGTEITALLYACKDPGPDDDPSLAFPKWTLGVPYFFSPFEGADDSVLKKSCDYY